jgi:hypothetical protein
MAGGILPVDSTPIASINIGSKLTLSVIITCIVVASSGLLYGYDLGVSGFFFLLLYSVKLSVYTSICRFKRIYSLFHFTLHFTYVHQV